MYVSSPSLYSDSFASTKMRRGGKVRMTVRIREYRFGLDSLGQAKRKCWGERRYKTYRT